MKENTYKKWEVTVIVAIIIIVLAIFFAVLYVNFAGHKEASVLPNDTESEKSTDSESLTESETTHITETELVTTAPQSEPIFDMPPEERIQAELDERCLEIISWLEASVPRYHQEAETDAEGLEIKPAQEYTPPVAFYYQDLATGCSMAYNADHVFYTASIIKEPYVLWVLGEIEKAEAEGTAAGTKFDVLSEFVYTEDKYRSGSGVIQKSEFGTVYTYLDLLKLSITQSDNVAFAEIRNIYGRAGFNAFSEKLGVSSTKKSLYSASAREMGAYLWETYSFFESGSDYAEMLKGWMLDTNHRIMIPRAVSPVRAANKYGWDLEAYHDMAIVFDDNPYLLVIMTELDNGSGADNSFIRELAGKINDAHCEILGDK